MESHDTPTTHVTKYWGRQFAFLLQNMHNAVFLLLFVIIRPQWCWAASCKDGSNKKQIITQFKDSAQKCAQKKAFDEVTLEAPMAPPLVSQTQESPVAPDSQTNLLVVACDAILNGCDGSPTANNTAIAEMTARYMNEDDDNDDGRVSVHTIMLLFNDNIGKHKAIKLITTSVFNFLCQRFVKMLSDNLLAAFRTPSSSAVYVRKVQSFFNTITYTKQTKVIPGELGRLAEKQ
jgi:hypothetical protein